MHSRRPSRHSTASRRWCVWWVVALAGWSLGCDDVPEIADADVAPSAPAAQEAPLTESAVPQVYLDLVASADAAHVRHGGPVVAPGMPGWSRVSQLADRGPWRKVRRIDDRVGVWLDGIGGTLHIPVGTEGAGLRYVEIWLRPIGPGQVVSVFFDEVPLTTMRVRPGWRRYRLPLPGEGVAPGEHSLRFWFRFTREHGGARTPAAFGGARLVSARQPPPAPEAWVGEVGEGDRRRRGLFAGPSTGWSWYVLPPPGSRLLAQAAVGAGRPVDFVVRIQADGEATVEARRLTVGPGATAELDVDLSAFAERPIRLSLDTEGERDEEDAASNDIERALWLEPQILHPTPAEAQLPPVRNVIVWVVDGLRDDRLTDGSDGARVPTPNLDLLARDGAAVIDVWSGGASAADGHERLLSSLADGPDLPTLMAATGRRTGFISTSRALDPKWFARFDTRQDLVREGEPNETRILLRELDAWLYVRKKDPFFLYLASADPRIPLKPAPGYQRLLGRARPLRAHVRRSERLANLRDLRIAYDAQVSATDYWAGQLVALLHNHNVSDDTAIFIVGSVGQELREAGGLGDGHALVPEVLTVPLIVWHPHLRRRSAERNLSRGGDLADVAATILRVGQASLPARFPGVDMIPMLYSGESLLVHPTRARMGNQVAARYGNWVLRGAGSRDLKLWDMRADPKGTNDLAESNPIAFRTLRDSMLRQP